MSQEVFQVVKTINQESLEVQLILQCGPFLTGVKISNLFIIQNERSHQARRLLEEMELTFFVLCVSAKKTTFLLYDREKLNAYLDRTETKALLTDFGYADYDWNRFIPMFKRNYQRYADGVGGYPHEIGLVLGYPVEDVKGFIENKGQNFLMAGYWKVYTDLQEKRKIFDRYEQSLEEVVTMFSCGMSPLEIISLYQNRRNEVMKYA